MNSRMTSASCCVLIGPKRLHVERLLTFLDDVSITVVKYSYILQRLIFKVFYKTL
jgi:hypothetical protein